MNLLLHAVIRRFRTGTIATAVLVEVFLLGMGCAHERTVVRHDSSSITYGVRKDAREEAGRNRYREWKRSRERAEEKRRRQPKNPTPGLENPSGKPQDLNMDSLRSILTGMPNKNGGGAGGSGSPAKMPSNPPTQGTGTVSHQPVPQSRSVPPPSR